MNDSNTYTSLLLRHKKLIWRLCRRYARHDPDRCADLVQEVSIALWEHYGCLRPDAGLLQERFWVISRTRTLLRNLHRGEEPPMLRLSREMADSMADERDKENDLLETLIDNLTEEERSLLQLRLDGYNAEEIAQRVGLTRDAVYQRLHRIVNKLKQYGKEN